MTRGRKYELHKNDKLERAVFRSAQLLKQHGLGKWKIRLTSKRNVLAVTKYDYTTIEFSKFFLLVAKENELIGVTLHEIAHAQLGYGHNHDRMFQELCQEISPTSDYIHHGAPVCISKYIYTCPICEHTSPSNIIKSLYCPECYLFDEVIAMESSKNSLTVVPW